MREIPEQLPKEHISLRDAAKLLDGTMHEQLRGCTAIRRMLSASHGPPIDHVISAGLLRPLVSKLSAPKLQLEAAWALTNVASGTCDQTAAVVAAGALEPFIALLDSDNHEVVGQAIWGLGNIAGDGPKFRDAVLRAGIVPKLMPHISSGADGEFLHNLTWVISNLCRNKPVPDWRMIEGLIEPLKCLLKHDVMPDVVTDACWAVSYLSDASEQHVQAVCESADVLARLVELVSSGERKFVLPALRALGNILTGSDSQTQMAIDAGFLAALPSLLNSRHQSVLKEACWALSNITAGTRSQCHQVVELGVVERVVEIIHTSEFKIQKEACYVIANLMSNADSTFAPHVVEKNAIPAMGRLLSCSDAGVTQVALEFFYNILKAGDRMPERQFLDDLLDRIEEASILDLFERLQDHENQDIYETALEIISKFFGSDDVMDGSQQKNADGFEFKPIQPLAEHNFQF